ncbi:MAG: glutathione S-transferase C-terminal domain-containing protein, partial [Rhodanobacter sp.]
IQWIFFQVGSIGPMFGQMGYFSEHAGKEITDKRPLERYVNESKRLLRVLDDRLTERRWMMGDDYTIADIATLGWVHSVAASSQAHELVQFDRFSNVATWLDRALARPAVQRGLEIPKRED